MFSLRTCSVAGCRRSAVDQSETCFDHLEDPSTWWAQMRGVLVPHKELSALNLSRVRVQNEDLSGRVFEGCNFIGSQWTDAILDGCSFRHCFFDFCSVSGSRMEDCDWTGSDLLHVNFNALEAFRTAFSESDLYFTRFVGSRLDHVAFIDCNLKKTQFSGSVLEEVNFRFSNYEEAEFDADPGVRL